MGSSLMPRLLMICYYFPPAGGAGAQRPTKFAKYLSESGWDVCVLCPTPESLRGQWAPPDPSLEHESLGLRVERVARAEDDGTWRPRVDSLQPWSRAAWVRARDLLRHERPDAVLVTMSPFSLAHVGLALKEEFQTPVVFDLRDPWALDGWPAYRTRWQWRRQRAFMRRALAGVDGIVVNTPEALTALRQEAASLPADRWIAIPNGYDARDFDGVGPVPGDPAQLTIVHAGSLHSGELFPVPGVLARVRGLTRYRSEPIRPEGRTIKYLLEALRRLRRAEHPGAERVWVRCIGVADAPTERCVQESGVADQVELTGYLPHQESVRAVMAADALFLPLHGYADRLRRSLIVPGKTYEYLASGRPILACLPSGDARDLVMRSGLGYLAYPTDQQQVTDALSRLLQDWRAASLPDAARPQAWLREYERSALSRRLGEFLQTVAGGSRTGGGAIGRVGGASRTPAGLAVAGSDLR